MASTLREGHVDHHSSPMDASEAQRLEAELIDELQLQEILLESLEGVPEDTSAARSEFENAIRNIKMQLKRLRRANTRPDPAHLNSHHEGAATYSAVSQKPAHISQPKKRTYSTHLDTEHPYLPQSKSRRTTPSSQDNFGDSFNDDCTDKSSVIDLTKDDDELPQSWMNDQRNRVQAQQRAEEERLRRKKEQEEDDKWLAQQLQNGSDSGDDRPMSRQIPGATRPLPAAANAISTTANVSSQPTQPANVNRYPFHLRLTGPEVVDLSSSPDDSENNLPLRTPMKREAPSSIVSSHQSPDERIEDWLRSSPPGAVMPGSFDGRNFESFPPPNYARTPSYGGLRGGNISLGPRPGALHNGHAASFGPGNSLGDIINRTNQYDWSTGLDHLGRPMDLDPLNQDGTWPSRIEDASDIRDLLANISNEEELPDDQAIDPPGLCYPLYTHQKIALKWMQGMEADEKKKGGILADDMGLGKTISTLALMMSRRRAQPTGNKSPAKTTLIVAPVALLRQWEREITSKVKPPHRLSVLNCHAKKVGYNEMRGYDVVLTSYGKLAMELKSLDDYTKKNAESSSNTDVAEMQKKFPFLGPKSLFYRIILDEAQMIKNSNTKSAKAAYHVQAEYRWCLSGTPMMNSVKELSSLVQFLRIKPYNNPKKFSETFNSLSAKNRVYGVSTAMRQLQTLLKAILLRRTKNSKINGQPIIDLPPKSEFVDHVIFGEDEHKYYRDLERDSQVKFSKFLREGSVGKKYQVVLVLLLRLRQACCHPYLHITDVEFVNNDIPLNVMINHAKALKPDAVRRIKEAEDFECPICYDGVTNPSILLCGHNTCPECLVNLTQQAEEQNRQAGNEGTNSTCPECRQPIDLKQFITYDIFKQVHMPEAIEETAGSDHGDDSDDETDSDSDSDSNSGDIIARLLANQDKVNKKGNLQGFVVDDDKSECDSVDEDYEALDLISKSKKKQSIPQLHADNSISSDKIPKKKKRKSKGKDKAEDVKPHDLVRLRKEAGQNKEARKRYMRYLRQIWLDSAKVTKCKEIIAEIQDSGEKTIVFSQWTLLLDLLEVQVSKELKLGFRRYDGGMSSVQRDSAVREFMENPDCKVMLVSLKAGNAGLNLTAASHVIIMDPFWNPYIESQAVDRAHRIGQQKPVKVHRVLIKDTVEDRIITLQEKKRELVDSALDEKAAKDISRLGTKDLAFLFGVKV
ncbi:SNF2 family N-terminal domain-containing protein [Xylariales sp. PMI_506]|nr:SNF2 family N-terminal domain-containing protein [Xylariales sp. PMI_506]